MSTALSPQRQPPNTAEPANALTGNSLNAHARCKPTFGFARAHAAYSRTTRVAKPPLAVPADIGGHTLLQTVNGSFWGAWFAAAGAGGVSYDETLYFNDAGLMLDAAVQGQGVALATKMLVENDLKSGRLVRPFELEIETGAEASAGAGYHNHHHGGIAFSLPQRIR